MRLDKIADAKAGVPQWLRRYRDRYASPAHKPSPKREGKPPGKPKKVRVGFWWHYELGRLSEATRHKDTETDWPARGYHYFSYWR